MTQRICLTSVGNTVDYPGSITIPTTDLTTIKLHYNSVIFMPISRYMCMDMETFYLNNNMSHYEWIFNAISTINK